MFGLIVSRVSRGNGFKLRKPSLVEITRTITPNLNQKLANIKKLENQAWVHDIMEK